ncbi:MAG: gamma-glutamyltransferase [Thermodesulfobacteria bacterium]|nr:gamma-glutamyltransferase [Thermodesulfobacteriota bacterium]
MSGTILPAIASGHPLVTEAAATILQNGGNAFDAIIGAGFTSAVVEPSLTSLGGGGFLLARPSGDAPVLYDFFVDTPGKGLEDPEQEPHFFPVTVKFPGCEQVFNIGPGAAAVPGNLKGFVEIQSALGNLPLKEVLAPATRYAKEGTRLNHHQAYFLSLLEPIMLFDDYGKKIFLIDGKFITEGQVLKNPELADFLERLGNDPEGTLNAFYKGEIAQAISKDMKRLGGLLTLEDLASYQVIKREPLSVDFSDFRLLTNPPPSFGGFFIAMAMELLSSVMPDTPAFGSWEHLAPLANTMKQIESYRQGLGSKLIWPDNDWFDSAKVEITRAFSRGTTHVSVCDSQGNLASMTTSNGEGSGYYVPGTGIMLNNMMGEDDLHPEGFHSAPPGTRVASMMSPSILMEKGKVRLVLGSGGSKRIRSAITQVITNTCFLGLGLRDAVRNPRIHLEDNILQVEPGYPDETIDKLKRQFELNLWNQIDVYFGGVHAIDPFGHDAQGDPRRGGAARVIHT